MIRALVWVFSGYIIEEDGRCVTSLRTSEITRVFPPFCRLCSFALLQRPLCPGTSLRRTGQKTTRTPSESS